MSGNENVTGGNGRNGKFMNLLDQYVPVRTLLTWGFIGVTAIIGGGKVEALMVQQFDSMSNQITIQSAQMGAQEIQLRQIQDTIISGRAARDQQMKQITTEFADLSNTVSDNHDDGTKQLALINQRIEALVAQQNMTGLQVGNITKDIATMKCQVMHRC